MIAGSILCTSRKLLFFFPAFFLGETSWNVGERFGGYGFFELKSLELILPRRLTCASFEKTGERADAVESNTEARICDSAVVGQILFRFLDADVRQVLMRRAAVDRPEQPHEMELGKAGFVGDLVEIDVRRKVGIDEELGPHGSEV